MYTTDNGDGTYTHTMTPGDATEALVHAMRLTRTTWPPEEFDGSERVSFWGGWTWTPADEQPGFGITIGWNLPHARWWQPYIAVTLWRRGFQVGWLYG